MTKTTKIITLLEEDGFGEKSDRWDGVIEDGYSTEHEHSKKCHEENCNIPTYSKPLVSSIVEVEFSLCLYFIRIKHLTDDKEKKIVFSFDGIESIYREKICFRLIKIAKKHEYFSEFLLSSDEDGLDCYYKQEYSASIKILVFTGNSKNGKFFNILSISNSGIKVDWGEDFQLSD